jgi:putative PEP-CTERM system TPR-repeat lipoprotein
LPGEGPKMNEITNTPRRNASVSRLTISAALLATMLGVAGCDTGPDAAEFLAKARTAMDGGDQTTAVIELKNALQKNPDNADARWLLGSIYLQARQGAAAQKELTRAKELGMNTEDLNLALVRAQVYQAQFAEALSLIDATEAPTRPDALLALRGLALLGQQKLVDAERAFADALKANSTNLEAQRGLARIALGQRRFSDAEAQLASALNTDAKDVESLLLTGEMELNKGKAEAALVAFERASEASGDSLGSEVGRVRALIALQRNEEAFALAQQLLTKSPGNPLINYFLAVAARTVGNIEVAQGALREVFRIQPNHPQSLLLMGSIHYDKKEFRVAEDMLNRFVNAVPNHLPGRKLLAAVHMRLSQSREAISALEPSLEEAKDDPQFLAMLGSAYLANNEFERGMALLETASKLDPDAAAIRTQLALSQLASGAADKAVVSLQGAVEVDPNFTRADLLLIITYLRQQKWDEAIATAQSLSGKQPKDAVPQNLLGAAYAGKGDLDKARTHYQKAIELNETFVEAKLNIAALDLRAGDAESALKRYQTILDGDPKQVRAAIAVAQIQARNGNRAEAIAILEASRAANDKALEPRIALLTDHLRNNRANEAFTLAQEASRIAPDNPVVQLGLAQSYAMKGDLSQAAKILTSLQAAQPRSADVRFQLGLVQMRQNDLMMAKASLRDALEINAEHYGARLGQGDIAVAEERYDDALVIAQELIDRLPESAGAYVLRGDVKARTGDLAAALTAYEKGFELSPSPQMLLKRYTVLANQSRILEGRKLLEQWISDHPDDATIRLALASIDQEKGDGATAAARYETVLAQSPNNVVALNNLAWVYFETGDPRAIKMAERAYELAPRVAAIADTYGWFLIRGGKLEQGLPILERAAKADPKQMEIQYHLAVALVEAGNRDRARTILKGVVESDFKFGARSEAERLYQAL